MSAAAVVAAVGLICTSCSSRIGLPLPKTTVTTSSTTTTTLPPSHHHVSVMPALKVVRSKLEVSSGERFVMRGVIVYAMPFYLDAGGSTDPTLASVTESAYAERWTMFARIKKLGFNTVKIPISSTVFASGTYGLSEATYLSRLRAIVNAATIEGLYVVLCWWDAARGGRGGAH